MTEVRFHWNISINVIISLFKGEEKPIFLFTDIRIDSYHFQIKLFHSEQICSHTSILFWIIFPRMILLSHTVVVISVFLRDLYTVFHGGWTNLYYHHLRTELPLSFNPFQYFLLLLFIYMCVHAHVCMHIEGRSQSWLSSLRFCSHVFWFCFVVIPIVCLFVLR